MTPPRRNLRRSDGGHGVERPGRPAARFTAAQGFLRSARGAPSFAPAMTYGLPSIRGMLAKTACATAERYIGFLTRFAVGKEKHATLEIDLRPLGVEEFREAARQ